MVDLRWDSPTAGAIPRIGNRRSHDPSVSSVQPRVVCDFPSHGQINESLAVIGKSNEDDILLYFRNKSECKRNHWYATLRGTSRCGESRGHAIEVKRAELVQL